MMRGILVAVLASLVFVTGARADCADCVSVRDGNTGQGQSIRLLSDRQIVTFCLMYEEGNSLHLLETILKSDGFTLHEFYAQYHLMDCHDSRMTPIYRFVMGGGNFEQMELSVELEHFRKMEPVRRFEILNRVHVFHRRDRSERMRMTLLDQIAMFSRNTAQPEAMESVRNTLVAMGAKRHRDLTEEERQRAPIRSRYGAN